MKEETKRICVICTKEFIVCGNLVAKYCSIICRNIYIKKRNYNYSKEKICLDCFNLCNNRSNYCRKCSYKYRDFNAERNPRWKGGRNQQYQINIYRSILINNGVNIDICAKCGIDKENTKKMLIHHIDGNHYNNIFSNLMPLCNKCHAEIHNTKDKINLICYFCKKEFRVIPSLHTRKYCSRKCSNRYSNSQRKGTQCKKIKKLCVVCEKIFFVFPGRSIKIKFCSQKCHYKHRRESGDGKRWNEEMQKMAS